jgi:small nuclear ribonucleoprotein (snRNP)-like protein
MSNNTNNNSTIRHHEIPVSLGKPSLRRRLEAYYSLIAPDQIADVTAWRNKFDQIWTKFGGSDEGELTLATKLAKKYGLTVRLLLASSSSVAVGSKNSNNESKSSSQQRSSRPSSTAVASMRDEAWFVLTDRERNSGMVQFVSDQFDPFAALVGFPEAVAAANKSEITIDQCPRLDRVDQCRSLLPTTDPLYRASIKRDRSKQADTGATSASHAQQQDDDDKTSSSRNKRPRPPACFSEIIEPYEDKNYKGPYSVLASIFVHRQRVRVVVRYVNGIRGTVTGYLVAFDKHMNMILRDADEVYSPRMVAAAVTAGENDVAGEHGLSNVEVELQRRQSGLTGRVVENQNNTAAATSTTATDSQQQQHQQQHHRPGWCVRQRHMAQILVRGDNVVLVYKAESERSAWPATSKSPAKSNYRNQSVKEVPPDQRVGTPGCLIYAAQRRPATTLRNVERRSDYAS